MKGAFFLIKHAIPVIPDGGAIILTASVAGANGGLGGKHGLRFDQSGAALVRPHHRQGVDAARRGVNTISPGPIVTPILDKGGLTAVQKDNVIEGAKTRIHSAARVPSPKLPPQLSTSPPMPPTPPALNYSSTAV